MNLQSIQRRQEQWRKYFPYRPDDMPGKQGDKAALRRIMRDPDIEREAVDPDLYKRLI